MPPLWDSSCAHFHTSKSTLSHFLTFKLPLTLPHFYTSKHLHTSTFMKECHVCALTIGTRSVFFFLKVKADVCKANGAGEAIDLLVTIWWTPESQEYSQHGMDSYLRNKNTIRCVHKTNHVENASERFKNAEFDLARKWP